MAHIQIRVGDALDLRGDFQVVRIQRVQGRQNVHRALQGIGAGVGHGGVGHFALHGDFHLQAAVVGRHHFVAEARGHHQVGVGQPLRQQPAGTHFAAKFFVVGEVQFDAASERQAQGFERTGGKCEGGKIALADRRGAAIHDAIFDLAAVGGVVPTLAGGHHIAVGIEGNGFAGAIRAAHDQVGDGLQAIGLDLGLRHRVFFCLKSEGL